MGDAGGVHPDHVCITNGIARVIDRARIVAADCRLVGTDELETCKVKLGILSQRWLARFLYLGCESVTAGTLAGFPGRALR